MERLPATTPRATPNDATEWAALLAETTRALARLRGHVDTLWSLAYEPNRSTDTGGRTTGGNAPADLFGIGDHRLRGHLADIAVCQLRLLARFDIVMNHLNAGPGADTNLRGSMISAAEFNRLKKARARRTDRGESETPLMPQPNRPKKGNR